jgi:hypothetical protein
MVNLAELEGIARGEFADIVLDVSRIGVKLRMLLIDLTFRIAPLIFMNIYE